MGISNTRQNLENSVARFKGERNALLADITRIEAAIDSLPEKQARVTQIDQLIVAAETLVRDSYPDWSADNVQPRRKADHTSPIPYGMLGRTALEVLRDTPGDGLPTRVIARNVMQRFNLDPTDRKLLDRTANSLAQYLKDNEGDLVESDGEAFYRRWRLIRPK